ncbi:hypothetical protein V6N13_014065 [Hibiscus sabdariffa]|uniref:Uncharacterized protein n=1 Tax=Hibiscus sabdariffa TaxID=183260 RepID=A0ABR2RUT7_9ROSI
MRATVRFVKVARGTNGSDAFIRSLKVQAFGPSEPLDKPDITTGGHFQRTDWMGFRSTSGATHGKLGGCNSGHVVRARKLNG